MGCLSTTSRLLMRLSRAWLPALLVGAGASMGANGGSQGHEWGTFAPHGPILSLVQWESAWALRREAWLSLQGTRKGWLLAVPLRIEVRETFPALKTGGEKGWASQFSVSPQALALLPSPPPIVGLPAPLPSACNFLPRRWREGNVKDDGLKGAVGVSRGGGHRTKQRQRPRRDGKIRRGEGRAETLKCCVEADGRERERWGGDGTNGAEILLEGQSPLKARDARELWTREQTEGDQSRAWWG